MHLLTHLNLIILIVRCTGYAEFELFPGFDQTVSTIVSEATDNMVFHTENTDSTPINRKELTTESIQNTEATTSQSQTRTHTTMMKKVNFKCPEEEIPKNIGPYEVPTQIDLVTLTKNILLTAYDSYSQQSMQLLKDIKKATSAALTMESKCRFNKHTYVQCVKNASKQCERYTKDSLINLEAQRLDVVGLTEDKICNLSDMKADPLQLIKHLAQEKSTLDFALPGFLMLINSCNAHCIRSSASPERKPVRHMTDQDLVIRHFLTKKNYIQLINYSKHKV